MSAPLTAAKWLMVGASCAGLIYGYWMLFWDDEWDWGWKNLVKDILSTCLLLTMLTIWPFGLRRYKREMGPFSFFVGLAALAGALGLVSYLTLFDGSLGEMLG